MAELRYLATEPAGAILERLEARYAAMRAESQEGIYHGEECILQAHCEFCEVAAAALMEVLRRCPTPPPPSEADGGAEIEVTIGRPGPAQLRLPLGVVCERAAAFLQGARRWATRALETTRIIAGEDSPAFGVWKAALESAPERGCWGLPMFGREHEPAPAACAHARAHAHASTPLELLCAVGTMDFAARWAAAGLSAPLAKP